MIYVDTSVILARLFAEDQRPDESFWDETLISSRLTQYETWTSVHRQGLGNSHGSLATALFHRVSFLEMLPNVLSRALEAFPGSVRTLDALHLASADYLRVQGIKFTLATYDARMQQVAKAMSFDHHPETSP